MANAIRGEAEVVLGGTTLRLSLNMRILAEIEDAFGADDFGEVFDIVFGKAAPSARQSVRYLTALLRANGVEKDDIAEVAERFSYAELCAAQILLMRRAGLAGDPVAEGGGYQRPPSEADADGSSGSASASAT